MSVIEVCNVSYRFHSDAQDVLHDVSFTVADGAFVSVLGPSGCGKSTLIHLMSGLILPTSGEIRVDGVPVTGPAASRSTMFQQGGLFPWMTARDNVAFAISKANRTWRKQDCMALAAQALEKVGLASDMGRWPRELSGGMAQRVNLARVLATGADVLLLDEVFSALDPRNRRDLQDLMLQLWEAERKTVVFVTHDIEEAIFMSDRIVFFEPARVRLEIPVEFSRPRKRTEVLTSARCCAMRKRFIAEFESQGEAASECI